MIGGGGGGGGQAHIFVYTAYWFRLLIYFEIDCFYCR